MCVCMRVYIYVNGHHRKELCKTPFRFIEHGSLSLCMHPCMYVCMHVYIYIYIYVCMHVKAYVHCEYIHEYTRAIRTDIRIHA